MATERAVFGSELPASVVVVGVEDGDLLASANARGAQHYVALRPGSTVKPLLAWIALDRGVLEPERRVSCRRAFEAVAGAHCFDEHGELSLTEAITVSCNVTFFQLAFELGLSDVRAGFSEFGLGEGGLLPDDAWLQRHSPNASPEESAISMGTGHGPIAVTLPALARAYGKLARALQLNPLGEREREVVKEEIMSGLLQVVAGEKGTAPSARVEGLDVAGKTGTAEAGPPPGLSPGVPENGWFVAFAPASVPEIVVAVRVLGGGAGGRTAAPIAREVLHRYAELR